MPLVIYLSFLTADDEMMLADCCVSEVIERPSPLLVVVVMCCSGEAKWNGMRWMPMPTCLCDCGARINKWVGPAESHAVARRVDFC